MKEKSIGIGLVASAVLALGIGWADSAQAFSLDSSVTVTNSIRNVDTQLETIFETAGPITVGSSPGLQQFGGIWDITFSNNSVLFSINSRFGNVTSGEDIYRFEVLGFGGPGQSSVTGFKETYLGSVSFLQKPSFGVKTGNLLEVIFPLGFATNLASIPKGNLAFRVDLTVKPPDPLPTPVPTPALLPGLVGMGLAALRRRQDRAA
jgi:hypothetical protein